MIRVDYFEQTFDGEIISHERRYFITSLDPAKVSPKKLMRLLRGHGQVENCLNFIKDRWWNEDRHWVILVARFISGGNEGAGRNLMGKSRASRTRSNGRTQLAWTKKMTLQSFVEFVQKRLIR